MELTEEEQKWVQEGIDAKAMWLVIIDRGSALARPLYVLKYELLQSHIKQYGQENLTIITFARTAFNG